MPERSIRRTLIVLALFLAAISDMHAQDAKWKFMVFSDSQAGDWTPGLNTNVFKETIRAILREQPAFVMFGGDFANIPSLSHFQEWTNLMWPVYEAGIKVYPVMGNHDTPDPASYFAVLEPLIPDNGPADELNRTYFFTHENVLVLMLDTYNLDPAKLLRVNQPWIDAVLATNLQAHVFAMGHAPRSMPTMSIAWEPTRPSAMYSGSRSATRSAAFTSPVTTISTTTHASMTETVTPTMTRTKSSSGLEAGSCTLTPPMTARTAFGPRSVLFMNRTTVT
jgi:hypothetical protein